MNKTFFIVFEGLSSCSEKIKITNASFKNNPLSNGYIRLLSKFTNYASKTSKTIELF